MRSDQIAKDFAQLGLPGMVIVQPIRGTSPLPDCTLRKKVSLPLLQLVPIAVHALHHFENHGSISLMTP